MKELSKAIQTGKKWKKETIKKSERETILEIETLGKRWEIINESIANRTEEIVERISGTEIILENTDKPVKENANCKIPCTPNIQKIQDTMRRPNLRIIDIEESENS